MSEEPVRTQSIRIESLAYGGDGVGHLHDGRAIFVPGGFPGDVARVRIVEDKGRFARGELGEVEEPGPCHVTPPCQEAACGRCGGCPWARLAYERQLVWKRQFVVDALTRIAGLDGDRVEKLVAPCRPSARQWNYRNKVEYEVELDKSGRPVLGMHAHGGPFVALTSCQLLDKKLQKAPKALTGSLRFLAGKNDLHVERVGIRHSLRTNDTEVAIWTQTGRFPRANAAKVIPSSLPVKRAQLVRVLLKGDAAKRKVAGVESLAGHGFWTEKIAGRVMALSAPSFFQVNTKGAETLIDLVMDGLQPDGLDSCLDLYSGAGTFTLPLAEASRDVIAVEYEGSSVRDLRRNLERSGLEAEVRGGDAARELQSLEHADKMVVDPPRAGLGSKAISGILRVRPRAIAYVSCNPTTLARDLAKLASAYHIDSVIPVDLFPQSYHVETVVIMSRVGD